MKITQAQGNGQGQCALCKKSNIYEARHWVSFYGAEVKEQPIAKFGTLRADLKKFIDDEIVKLEKELEKL